MLKCAGFSNDNHITINILSSILHRDGVCARHQAVLNLPLEVCIWVLKKLQHSEFPAAVITGIPPEV